MAFEELRRVAAAFRKAAGEEIKERPKSLLDAEAAVARLKSEVAELRRLKTREEIIAPKLGELAKAENILLTELRKFEGSS